MRCGKIVLVGALLAGCGAGQGAGREAGPRAQVPFLSEPWPNLAGLLPQARPASNGATPQVVAGATYVCGLRADGRVVCWGAGPQGQLGNALATPGPSAPYELPLSGVRQIAAGAAHACALLDGGEVHCWGSNARGQLGQTGRDARVRGPTRLPLDVPIKRLADAPLCAVSEDDEVYCWGEARRGEQDEPARVSGLPAVRSLSVSDERACVISFDADMVCWSGGEAPARVAMPGLLTQLSLRSGSGCALDTQGQALCWGALPQHKGDLPAPPTMVRGLGDATQVAVGEGLGCALRKQGTVACWGDLLRGGPWSWELARIVPHSGEAVEVPGVAGATGLTLGNGFSCVLRRDGRVVCWGSNEDGIGGTGQADPPLMAPRVVAGVDLSRATPAEPR